MSATFHAFAESRLPARRLAKLLDLRCAPVGRHLFPDGESLIRVATTGATAVLYRSLDHPNEKLVEVLLAASALRDRGARHVILLAPYLGYMRQDIAFSPGEAVSQRVLGKMLAGHFDGVLTVVFYLNSVRSVAEVMPGIAAVAVSAAGVLAEALRPLLGRGTLLIGPDLESRPWVASVARPLGLDMLVGEKRRFGDRQVELTIDGIERVRGRRVLLIDDVISSGGTLLRCAEILKAAGARRIDACATHCLASPADLQSLRRGGISSIRATDTVSGPASSIPVAPALSDALRRLIGDLAK